MRQHHERRDGKGYPDGLAGEEISLEARILNLCDSVAAMASDRPYSKGRTPEEIIAEVRACAGTQFDPQIAELFISLVEQYGYDLLVNTAIPRYLDPSRSAPEPAPYGVPKPALTNPLLNQAEVNAT
nr:HD domain-containing phosphohydrolase [Chloroflexus sp.]